VVPLFVFRTVCRRARLCSTKTIPAIGCPASIAINAGTTVLPDIAVMDARPIRIHRTTLLFLKDPATFRIVILHHAVSHLSKLAVMVHEVLKKLRSPAAAFTHSP
jgi:hypothetical protein